MQKREYAFYICVQNHVDDELRLWLEGEIRAFSPDRKDCDFWKVITLPWATVFVDDKTHNDYPHGY